MRIVLAALALLIAISPAAAADQAKGKAKGKGNPEEVASYVNLSPVAVPVIVNSRVVNYIFVRVRVNLTPGVDSPAIREKEPFFRDALVRAAHRTPFTLAGDYTRIDEAKLNASMLADARRIAGANAVTGVEVLSQVPKSTRVAAR